MTNDDDEIDRLLKQREIAPPDNFSACVMSLVSADFESPVERPSIQSALQWVALGLGGVYGMGQTLYFLLGIWVATATG